MAKATLRRAPVNSGMNAGVMEKQLLFDQEPIELCDPDLNTGVMEKQLLFDQEPIELCDPDLNAGVVEDSTLNGL